MSYYIYERYTLGKLYHDEVVSTETMPQTSAFYLYAGFSLNTATGIYSLINQGGSGALNGTMGVTYDSDYPSGIVEYSYLGSTTTLTIKHHKAFYVEVKGSIIDSLIYDEYDGLPSNGIYMGYWYVKAAMVTTNAPTFTLPGAGAVLSAPYQVTWQTPTTNSGHSLTYNVDLSLDGGTSYHSIGSNLTGNSLTYDFTKESYTTNAKLRIQALDTYNNSSYGYSSAFTIIPEGSGYQMMI